MKPVKDPRQNSDPSLFSWTNAWEKVWSCCYLNMQKLFIGCFGATSRQWKLPPGYEDPTVLTSETMFTVSEIEALYELFKKLSSSVIDDGQIHKEEFKLALLRNGKRKDLIADRVFELFDVKQNGVIGFGEFVRSLSIFHPEARFEDKVSYAFKMYDLRQTGFIDREEVEQMIRALMMESDVELLDEVVSTILDKTFTEVDTKKDGKIDEEEWKAYVMKNPALMKNMSLPYLMDLTTSFPRFYISREESDK